MTKNKLTALCHKVSRETGLSFNQVMLYFFLECILKKLAESKYNKNFIFKGGFLLSNVIGVESRSTVDMDFLIQNHEFQENEIVRMLEEAFNADDDSNIKFSIYSKDIIKKEDKYGGFRFTVLCELENIRQLVPLDIATGDVITPYPIDYSYRSIFNNNDIKIKAYPIETIIAEKMQTIYSRGLMNSRSKDYYDLHIIYSLKENEINFTLLRIAMERTFTYRNTELDYDKILKLLLQLEVDYTFVKRWDAYRRKNKYVDVEFSEVIRNIISLANKINSSL